MRYRISKTARAVALMAAAFAYSSSALSQIPNGAHHRKYESSVFGGVSFARNYSFPTRVFGSNEETTRNVGMRYAGGYVVGVRAGQSLGESWHADGEYNVANQRLHFTNLSPDLQDVSFNQAIHRFSYDVSYLPVAAVKRFRPYARVGAGLGLFHFDDNEKVEARVMGLNLNSSWVVNLNVGGGFKYLVNDQTAVIFNAKDQISSIPSYGLNNSARVSNGKFYPGIATTGFMHNLQINLGLEFQWD